MSEVPDWLHRREHIEQRSQRKGETEQNILVEWADEAYLDESAVTFDPDYASETGALGTDDRLVGLGRIPHRCDHRPR